MLMIELVIMKIDSSEVNHLFSRRENVTGQFAGDFKPGWNFQPDQRCLMEACAEARMAVGTR